MRDIPESRVEPYAAPPAMDEAAELLTGSVIFRAARQRRCYCFRNRCSACMRRSCQNSSGEMRPSAFLSTRSNSR
jgi:hypothetical protein